MKPLRSISWLSFEGFGVSSPFDPSFHYVTSPVFSPVILGALRLLFAVYALITAIITLVFDSVVFHDANTSVAGPSALTQGNELTVFSRRYFSYFTELSYIGLVAYFWASSVQTIAFVLRGRKSYPLQTWPLFFQLLHVLLYSSLIVFRELSRSLSLPFLTNMQRTISHYSHSRVLVSHCLVGNVSNNLLQYVLLLKCWLCHR